MISSILGGIGLFLLGMILLTDGLKSLAGEALRSTLVRFTGGPLRGVASGIGATAVLQSSSATIMMTIGFVSAGLLTFPQAIGVIMGAAVGTTSTSWIVSTVGLKLSLSVIALPVVGVGALLRLLGRGRVASSGLALAGFGLIFVGIDTLQSGMEVLASGIEPASLPGATAGGRFILVVAGVIMTVVMQSSSAAVATTLAAVHSGAVDVFQAATLVVGQSIGTTSTSAIAGLGGSSDARRTAAAHVFFNLFAGSIAFVALPTLPYLAAWLAVSPAGFDSTIFIAGFHTGFHLLAMLIVLPVTRQFGRLIERIVPERGPVLTRHLDPSVARVPEIATEAARRTMIKVAAVLVDALDGLLHRPTPRAPDANTMEAVRQALGETTRFLGIVESWEGAAEFERELAVLHTIDHLERLAERIVRHPRHPAFDPTLSRLYDHAHNELRQVRQWLKDPEGDGAAVRLQTLSGEIAKRRREERQQHLRATAAGHMEPDAALAELEAMRWLDACIYHLWRALFHLGREVREEDAAGLHLTVVGEPDPPSPDF